MENLPIENFEGIEKITFNKKELDIDEKVFLENDIIIIKSGTGTGKTKEIARKIGLMKDKYPNSKIMSIVNLISLAEEQRGTFLKEGEIKLNDYRNSSGDQLVSSDCVICLNSLVKLKEIKPVRFSNTILFIDEINSIINTFTHNDKLDSSLNTIDEVLQGIIKHCRCIIVSDATINSNVFNFLSMSKLRKNNNKCIIIENTNKKYENIYCSQYATEELFYNKLKECIKNNEYFLFACDVRNKLKTIFERLAEENPEKVKYFILITSETDNNYRDASFSFKDRFVFYSPSITTGVSFVSNTAQYQFQYVSSSPEITPENIYQQSSRTRNMKELIIYCENDINRPNSYTSLEDCENKHQTRIRMNERILRLSTSRNLDEEQVIIKNRFFKMYCYNEYIKNIYYTDYLNHLRNIYKEAGFILRTIGDIEETKREKMKRLKEHFDLIKQIDARCVDNFINRKYGHYKYFDENGVITNDNDLPIIHQLKEDVLQKRFEIIGFNSEELTRKYSVFLTDNYAINNYWNFQKLFYDKEFIKKKFKKLESETKKEKLNKTNINKLYLLYKFEKFYNIKRFDFKFETGDKVMTDEKLDYYLDTFRIQTKTKPTPQELYVKIINNIVGDIPMIKSKQERVGGNKRIRKYSLEKEVITEFIKLTKLKNATLKHYNLSMIEELTGIKPDEKVDESKIIVDGEETFNNYLDSKYGIN